MPRLEVLDHWKAIIVLSMPKSIELYRSIGYDYNLKIIYEKSLVYEYKYNLNNNNTIKISSIDLFINGKYNRSLKTLNTNEKEDRLLYGFITFMYSCHNNIDDWKINYNIFTYSTSKLMKKFICTIL